MTKLLQNKVAVISGANRGIGKCIAETFAENGANIIACMRSVSPETVIWMNSLENKFNISVKPVLVEMSDEKSVKKSIKEIIKQPIELWKKELINDFEHSVFQQYPFIKEVKKVLYSNGAIYASLSGSGSTVFGIFNEKPEITFSKEVQRWDFNL